MLGRFAVGPVRAAVRSGRGLLADETERAIDAALAGPLPETVARSLAEHRVLERVLEQFTSSSGDGSGPAQLEAVATQLLRSPAMRRELSAVLASPELRKALSEQTKGFGGELAESAEGKARVYDDRADAWARGLLQRPVPAESKRFGGVASRGLALAVDAALAQASFIVIGASVGLILALAGGLRPGWVDGALAGGGWLLVVACYFTVFWSGTGQTPGLRLMGLRVERANSASLSVARSLLRFAGLILAIIPLGAGFLPALVDARRRALPDYLAGTVVVHEQDS
jgi:uncharacterized RDD family membrane protein YckC